MKCETGLKVGWVSSTKTQSNYNINRILVM